MTSRDIPDAVRRQLRQEAFFGCAKCGAPILEYHHIIPWAERQQHIAGDMVALCPTHHTEFGKKRRQLSYDLKAAPYNSQHGFVNGSLGTEAIIDRLILGSNTYIDTPIIVSYYEQPLISYRVEGDVFLLSAYVPSEDLWPELKIVDNELSLNRNDAWDFVFRTNYLKLKRNDGSFFEVDIRRETAVISGSFSLRGELFDFGGNATKFGGLTMSGNTFRACGAGLSVGDSRHKVYWPHYAMLHPEARFELMDRRC